MENMIREGLSFALPLFIMAIGGIYSEKSGVTNLALEGLQGFGAFGGALVAVAITQKLGAEASGQAYYLAIVVAILFGMLFSLIHALLCIRFQANQVISGVVINILALAATSFLTKQINKTIFHIPSDKFVLTVSDKINLPLLSEIPIIGAAFKGMYPFELIIVLLALLAWYVLYKTRFGLHLRACGENPHAVDAAGVSVSQVRLIAVLVSGALAGLAGISFAYSISANFSAALYSGYGYLAIAAMIFGNWQIVPTLGACLLFGFARSGGYEVVQALKLPSTYSDIIMTLPYVLTLLLLVFFSKKNQAPSALGEVYDKGKR
ncbi:ABC transporter permease [Enterococcus rivorum]|uniref:ABC transporter permease n=2 Tax=Enterococcus rivorum TaxID=762845 RepID=A0A1E5KVW5_9ENTE|nr:ABC transporter permease [Enterococcus rivorum]MBP2100385.1 simple sugar transport system permease protein [Enterococcus rivorum]OEH81769.1 ABC transporter permease [Enterococcus rivorum]